MIKKTLAAVSVLAAITAGAEVRFWADQSDSASLTNEASWSPALVDGFEDGDKLYLNTGTNHVATVSEGETVTVPSLTIGRGMRWDYETSNESNNVEYDLGGRLDVSGGFLDVTNTLYVGGGFSDNSNDVLNVTGGKVSVKYLRSADCATNNGKRNEINVTGGLLELTGETALSTYSGGTTHMDVSGSGIVSNTAYFRSSSAGKTFIDIHDGGTFVSMGELRIGQNTANTTVLTVSEGGLLETHNNPHVGEGGKGEIVVDGGTVEFGTNETFLPKETYIGQGDNGDGRVTVKSGTVNAYTFMIGRDGSEGHNPKGALDLQGGVTVCSNAEWYGTLNLGWGTASDGTLLMANDAELEVHGYTAIGRSGKGLLDVSGGTMTVTNSDIALGHDATGRGTMKMTGGTVTANSTLYVGRSGTGSLEFTGGSLMEGQNIRIALDESGVGSVKLNGGTVNLSGFTGGVNGHGYLELNNGAKMIVGNAPLIADNATAVADVVVNSGIFQGPNDIYVSYRGKGALTINGGEVVCDWWLDIVRDPVSTNKSCVLNLNGGELKVGLVHTCIDATMNWNGGVYKPNENYEYVFEVSEGANLTVNVGKNGAIFDSGVKNRSINRPLSGAGNFVKRGTALTTIKNPIDVKRGFMVEAGKLVMEQGVSSTVPMKEIVVAENAELDLGAAEVTVFSYKVAGSAKAPGTYAECNGTIHVLDGTPATALWTNASGDGDTANAENWTVKSPNGDVLYDVLPTADTVVTVPYGENLVDWSSVAAETLIVSFAGAKKLHGDATVPAIVPNAIAWYDPSDAATVAVNADGGVTKVTNKGVGGAGLDVSLLHPDGRKPGYDGNIWSQNGHTVLAMTNAYGFVSKDTAGLTNGQDRTLITLACQQRNTYHAINDQGEVQEGYENQMFPIGLGSQMWSSSGRFGIELWWDGAYHCFYPAGTNEDESYKEDQFYKDGDYPEWMIWDMGSRNGEVRANWWDQSGDEEHHGPSAASPLNESADVKIVLGQRWLYNGPSAGLLAETMVFDRGLSDEELAVVRTYLRTKWFDYIAPSLLPSAISLDAAAVDLNGTTNTLSYLSGSGTLTNGTVSLNGVLEVTVKDNGTIDPITIDGDFDLSNVTVKLVNAKNLTSAKGNVTFLNVTGALTGTVKAVTADDEHSFGVKVSGAAVSVYCRGGLIIMFR